jgi:type IV pilus assembly protein PilQ
MSGLVGGATLLMSALPVQAAAQVTAVQLNPTAAGVNILLQTKGGDRPQVFSVHRGNSWTADIINTRLQLPGGSFRQANPAPGIALVSITPLDQNSVRVTVTGQGTAPVGQIARSDNGSLVFNLTRSKPGKANVAVAPASKTNSNKPVAQGALRSQKSTALPVSPSAPASSLPSVQPSLAPLPNADPSSLVVPPGQPLTIAQAAPPPPSPLTPFPGTPLVPNPQVKYQADPATRAVPAPPFAPNPLPRAIAPPVGDIAIGQIDASPGYIDLGTAERVPRLVLRDASAREVLSLLARSAGMNLVFTAETGDPRQQQQPGQPGAALDGPKVTLDIINEPIQNVFNYVLQVTGLEASRRGSTIFVGSKLPNSARNMVVRSLRLNQMKVSNALNYLVALGAESAISRERLVTNATAVPIGSGSTGAITQTQSTTEQKIETQRIDYKDSIPILRGVQVSGDERTDTVTLIGEARKVEIAVSQLSQLDVRRRQVAVNVRVIDINLLAFDRIGTSFSFGVNDTQVINTGGAAIINFGSRAPAFSNLDSPLTSGGTVGTAPTFALGPFRFVSPDFFRGFLGQLQAAVTNGSAKILTDPTLVVQEGQTARVELSQEVITNIKQNVTATQSSTQITVEVEKEPAGLTLPIKVDKIDDNGFISLSLIPEITRPQQSVNITFTNQGQTVTNPITLLARRKVESGQVRLRDGQSLVLSGIIQDEDRSTVTKIPILGDIPILGALFRRTEKQNERREVIVLLTPRVLDDSDRSGFGYSYTPGPEIQRMIKK